MTNISNWYALCELYHNEFGTHRMDQINQIWIVQCDTVHSSWVKNEEKHKFCEAILKENKKYAK